MFYIDKFKLIWASIFIFLATPGIAAPPPVPAMPMLNLNYGQVAVFDSDKRADRFGIEFRFRPFGRWALIPAIGYAEASNDASFLYADLRHDFWINQQWVLTPSLGVGAFDNEEELDLGDSLEFRTGVEIAYRFQNNFRLGLSLFHLSNAGISNDNPGTEALVVSLSIPIGGSM